VNTVKKCDPVILSVKDVDEKTRIVKGVLSDYETRDSQKDRVQRGFYAKSIKERGPKAAKPRIKHLRDHSTLTGVGIFQELWEDNDGLNFVSKMGTWSTGDDTLKMYREGLITEHSVMIEVNKSLYDRATDTNILQEGTLWEGSALQAWGSNPNTPTKSKTIELLKTNPSAAFENYRKLMKVLKNGDLTDDTMTLIEIEIRQIELEFKTILETEKPQGDTDPGQGGEARTLKLWDPEQFKLALKLSF
jgi:uncharacterized protein